jgi:hypothetical protein
MRWICYSTNLQHIAFAYCIYRWFPAFPSPLHLPQSGRNPRRTSLVVPEGGDRRGAKVDDAAEVPRPAPSTTTTVPVRDLLAQRLLHTRPTLPPLCTYASTRPNHASRVDLVRMASDP